MVLPKRSTNVSLTKFESRSWIKQTPRSFPFSRSRTTNLAVLAENLSVTPPTPHDWSLRPMVLCLNRTGKRSEIYNLHIVGLQREDSPRKLPHPKKQRFNLPTPFTLWLSLGPPYGVFFSKFLRHVSYRVLPQVGHRKDTATVATNDPMSLRGASRIDSSTKGTLDMNLPGGGYRWMGSGCWWLNFQPAKSPRIFLTHRLDVENPGMYIYPKGFSHHQLMGVFFFETVHNGADFSYSNPSTWCWSDFSFHLEWLCFFW